MRIKVLRERLIVPGLPAFFFGHEYLVEDSLGHALVSRGEAEEVKEEESSEEKPESKKKSKAE